MDAKVATTEHNAWSDPFTSLQTPRPVSSFCRTRANHVIVRIAHVRGAPPGVYQHMPHGGRAIYMAQSRKVGSIDVGEGEVPMRVQVGEFIVGAPSAAARMHSFRGGHWLEVVLAEQSVGLDRDEVTPLERTVRWRRRSFHKERKIADLLTRIVRGGLSARPTDPLHLDTLGHALADALDRFFNAEHSRRREVRPLSKSAVDEILDYMDAHLAEPIALNDLACLAGLTPTRFAKAFRNAAGESPYQALIRRRLEAARFALMTGNGSISDISLAYGFSSQQHLTGLFSRNFGIAPGEFRNQMRSA